MADGEGLGATGDAQTHTGHPGEPSFPYNGHFLNENALIFFLSKEGGSLHGLLLTAGARGRWFTSVGSPVDEIPKGRAAALR